VVLCRPILPQDRERLSPHGSAAGSPPSRGSSPRHPSSASSSLALEEISISDASESVQLPEGSPDAGLLRDIDVGGAEGTLRLPLYGYGGAAFGQLCTREVAPLVQALSKGESATIIAYGKTGGRMACGCCWADDEKLLGARY
jgi:hypothetical protein